MFYTEDTIRELKERCDIVDIINRFVPLKRSGSRWVGICPFHSDHNPSMLVTPSMGIYKCFVCGASGDSLKFVMEHERMDFASAIEWLAETLHYTLPKNEFPNAQQQGESRLVQVLEEATTYFEYNLHSYSEAKKFLEQRKITTQTAQKYRLGAALDSWDGLLSALQSKGYSRAELLDAGLVLEKDTGRCYDRFRNRLLFPIQSLSKKVVGFGGRILNPADTPKYLNSPETKLYRKSDILYGFHLARTPTQSNGTVYIVEGYMDLVKMDQHGISNVVAVSGTALTPRHVDLIRRYAQKAILLFDGDEAGFKAAERSLVQLIPSGVEARVLALPGGEDPDSYLDKYGVTAFKELPTMDFISFIAGRSGVAINRMSPENKKSVYDFLLPLIQRMNDAVLKQEYHRLLLERLQLDTATARMNIPSMAMKGRSTVGKTVMPGSDPAREMLALLMSNPELFECALQWCDLALFPVTAYIELLELCLVYAAKHTSFSEAGFYEVLSMEQKQLLSTMEELTKQEEWKARNFFYGLLLQLNMRKWHEARKQLDKSHPGTAAKWVELTKKINSSKELDKGIRNGQIPIDQVGQRFALLFQREDADNPWDE
jgi:DNA primase catalytic core